MFGAQFGRVALVDQFAVIEQTAVDLSSAVRIVPFRQPRLQPLEHPLALSGLRDERHDEVIARPRAGDVEQPPALRVFGGILAGDCILPSGRLKLLDFYVEAMGLVVHDAPVVFLSTPRVALGERDDRKLEAFRAVDREDAHDVVGLFVQAGLVLLALAAAAVVEPPNEGA